MNEVDNSKLEKAHRLSQTVQPYMLFVGEEAVLADNVNVNSFYITINRHFLKPESPLKSLDVCFKSFFQCILIILLKVIKFGNFFKNIFIT